MNPEDTPTLPAGHVEIRGKAYKTVALRIQEFWEKHSPEQYGINTDAIEVSPERVLVRAEILRVQGGEDPRVIASGYAEETRTYGVNVTSALENAETSAIGRALACFGLAGSVMDYASADEMARAVWKDQMLQEGKLSPQKLKQYAEAMRNAVDAEDGLGLLELFDELTPAQVLYLWGRLRSYERRGITRLKLAAEKERAAGQPEDEGP